MTEMTSYAARDPVLGRTGDPGPGRVDRASTAPCSAGTCPRAENAEQTGGYRLAAAGGSPSAGMMPQMQEGQPTAWTTYVSVEDADATAAAVKDAGGTVMAEPMDVMDLGRMAVFADPSGAVFGVWQPGTFAGAGLVNEPGAIAWNELNTRDLAAAKEFYGAVFGWEFKDTGDGRGGTYTTIVLGERMVGGMFDMAERHIPERGPAALAGLLRRRGHRRDGRAGQGGRGRGDVRAGRHPGRPLRDPHRPTGRELRGDRAQPRRA